MKIKASLFTLLLVLACAPSQTLLGRTNFTIEAVEEMDFYQRLGLNKDLIAKINEDEAQEAIEHAYDNYAFEASQAEEKLLDQARKTLLDTMDRTFYNNLLELKEFVSSADRSDIDRLKKYNYYQRLGLDRKLLSAITENYRIQHKIDIALGRLQPYASPAATRLLKQARNALFNKVRRERYNRRMDLRKRAKARRAAAPARGVRPSGAPSYKNRRQVKRYRSPGSTEEEQQKRIKRRLKNEQRRAQREKSSRRPSKRSVRGLGYRRAWE